MNENNQLEKLQQLAATIRTADRVRLEPPEGLWSKIAAELDAGPAVAEPEQGLVRREVEVFGTGPVNPPSPDQPPPIDTQRERLRKAPNIRRSERRALALAAICIVVAGVTGFSLLTSDAPERVARADLDNGGLAEQYEGGASAIAELVGSEQRLIIDFDSPLPQSEPVELWLIKNDLSEVRSLGFVDDVRSYSIPAGIDLSEYSLVDVSIEPDDGDPTHSGRSILRGELKPL